MAVIVYKETQWFWELDEGCVLQRGKARHMLLNRKESSELIKHTLSPQLFFKPRGKNCTPFSEAIFLKILCPFQSWL